MKTAYYKAPAAIFARGNPDGATLGGMICEPVHSYIPPTRDGCHQSKAQCGNGAFNCWMTSRRKSVTCPACLQKLHTLGIV